ncbi:MAG: uncharacterized protein KVP18_003314 [Porospora cf. gigantea A]|uniref:uncharacterized protein n=1 Tax=Porospora cf. gigantea A TaxID=2853593 RepID=UPI00355953E1|nr:MAG: hypothetical protein KVP18_003314 [Porospora cf. gigantea A]
MGRLTVAVAATALADEVAGAAYTGNLKLYHFNDQHARWAKSDHVTNSLCFKGDANYNECAGGVAKRAAFIKGLSAETPYLVLDAGDEFQGTPLFNGPDDEMFGRSAKLLQKLWKHQSVDVFVLGNHEFDNGVPALSEFLKGIQDTPLNGRDGLTTELLCANCKFDSGNCNFDGVKLKKNHTFCFKDNARVACSTADVQLKIGAIGLSLEGQEMSEVTMLDPDCDLSDWKSAALEQIEAIGADVHGIVLVTHIGIINDRILAGAIEDKKANGDAKAKKVFAIVGGHSHTMMCDNAEHWDISCKDGEMQVPYPSFYNDYDETDLTNKVPIYQDYWAGRSVGEVTVKFEDGKVPQVVLIDGAAANDDTDLIDLDVGVIADTTAFDDISAELSAVQKLYEDVRTVAQEDLSGGKPACREPPLCALGVIGTDAMLGYRETMYNGARSDVKQAVIAIQNGGGVRTEVAKGSVSWGTMNEVYPFYNFLQSAVIPGQNLIDNVKWGIWGTNPMIQFSGLRVTLPSKDFSIPTEELACSSKKGVSYSWKENYQMEHSPIDGSDTAYNLRYTSAKIDFVNIEDRSDCSNISYNTDDITVHYNKCISDHLTQQRTRDGKQPPYPFPKEVFNCDCWADIDPKGEYPIVTHNFLSGGGDGYCLEPATDWYSQPEQPIVFDSMLEWASKGEWAAQPENYHYAVNGSWAISAAVPLLLSLLVGLL